jgi:exopolyphosphatase / guanosine-5'-triphosphate,3'-diphosphate pyrophosphatase
MEGRLAGGLGFEPRQAESESAVLPLDDPPTGRPFSERARALQGRPDAKDGRHASVKVSGRAPEKCVVLEETARHARRKRQRHRRPLRVAALDLGTNNCRLLIASQGRGGNLRIVDSFSRIVRLGEGIAQTGELTPAAIERTLEALKICAGLIRASGARRTRAIATEACRRASNAQVLIQRARDEAGIELAIISVEEEARLAALGCAPLIDPEAEGGLVFDIGGGSTEVIWMRREPHGTPVVAAAASASVGVVTFSEQWAGQSTDRAGYARMREAMIGRFRPIRAAMDRLGPFNPATHHLLGTSGTVTTLAGVALGLARYNRTRVDASWHRCVDILSVVDRIVALDPAGRAAVGCVGPDRADLIVPGCAIFSAIVELWPCTQLRVADRGLREGILRELLAEPPP